MSNEDFSAKWQAFKMENYVRLNLQIKILSWWILKVVHVVLRYSMFLRAIYGYYCRLGLGECKSVDNVLVLSQFQFSRLLKDIKLQNNKLGLPAYDRMTGNCSSFACNRTSYFIKPAVLLLPFEHSRRSNGAAGWYPPKQGNLLFGIFDLPDKNSSLFVFRGVQVSFLSLSNQLILTDAF